MIMYFLSDYLLFLPLWHHCLVLSIYFVCFWLPVLRYPIFSILLSPGRSLFRLILINLLPVNGFLQALSFFFSCPEVGPLLGKLCSLVLSMTMQRITLCFLLLEVGIRSIELEREAECIRCYD